MHCVDITLVVGEGSPKKEDRQMSSTRGVTGPNYSSYQAKHNQDNPISEPMKAACPRSPRSKHFLGDQRQTTKAIKLKAKKGSRDMQIRGGGNF